MRLALQRLLSRPYSHELLRYLTCTSPKSSPRVPNHSCSSPQLHQQVRRASEAAATPKASNEEWATSSESPKNDAKSAADLETVTEEQTLNDSSCDPELSKFIARNLYARDDYRKRDYSRMTFEELDFESDLAGHKYVGGGKRLVHQIEYRNDFELWVKLLEHRRRVHGIEGVRVIWDKMKTKTLHQGSRWFMGGLLWDSFIDLGLVDLKILQEVVSYALKKCTEPHPTLYVRIIQHFAMQGNVHEVRFWHRQLISQHPPSPRRFRQMVRFIINGKGDLNILKYIYAGNDVGSLYSKVVPVLCAQMKFEEALQWHYTLLQNLDLPLDSAVVEPLKRHLECYFPKKAAKFTESLIGAEVEFLYDEPTTSIKSKEKNVYDDGMKHVAYNDSLGAKWFATTWISLDFAINAIYAIGVQEIGPLSLQALAWREPTAAQISDRISQFKTLGISIGKSRYSQAIERFSRKGMHSLLRSLLESDMHPDALEDSELQEALLGRYAALGDWAQYSRTMAICLLETHGSEAAKLNLLLRDYLIRPSMHIEDITSTLGELREKGLPVEPRTSRYLLRRLLRRRQKGRRPVHLRENPYDIENTVSIFKAFLKSGSWIPEILWAEIIRRFGMTGRLKDLESLCLFLADWYHPKSGSRKRNMLAMSQKSHFLKYFVITSALNSSHPKHTFSLLFPASLQMAIVEWGFIHYFRQFPKPVPPETTEGTSIIHTPVAAISSHETRGNHPISSGISLLLLLRDRGVHIHRTAIRSAIQYRLIEYYGFGVSKKFRNRTTRYINPFTFDEMLDEVQKAWAKGGPIRGRPRNDLFRKRERSFLRAWIWQLSVNRFWRTQRRGTVIFEKRVQKQKALREGVFTGAPW